MRRAYAYAPYFLIAFCFGLIFFTLSKLTAVRVGDGAEYYALYYAWRDTLRPWMSPASFASYQELVGLYDYVGMVPADQLAEAFHSLRVGVTSDFNHFWFYSFLAFSLEAPLQVIGVSLGAHKSFLLLHYTLLLCLFITLFRLYRWRGLSAGIIMTLLSPMVWYMDKVHTELFTFVFTLLAVAFVHRRLYLTGALCLAMASTQNISFALIAFFPFFYRIIMLREKRFSTFEVISAISTALLVLVHPTYYFFRYGVPTPQFLAGGASLGGNLSTIYIWLFDPDLGLLPFWPIGIVTIALSLFIFYTRKVGPASSKQEGGIFFCFFILVFLMVNLYANASTTNLNSGASPGPARYALWYLPLFLPAVLYVLSNLGGRKILLFIWITALALSAWLSVLIYDPRETEKVATPSYLSLFIQTNFSELYSPPYEVFSEKYSGFGEQFVPRAILGPDCRKLLIYPESNIDKVTASYKCFVDESSLKVAVDSLINDHSGVRPFYTWLNNDEIFSLLLRLSPGVYGVGQGRNGNFIMGPGWSGLEDFWVWSDGREAKLSLPCNSQQFYYGRDRLSLRLVVRPFGKQYLTVKHQGRVVYRDTVSSESEINIDLKPGTCKSSSIDLEFYIANPRSPLELGQSDDIRKLGIALLRYSLN
jgi:hypothetical protein